MTLFCDTTTSPNIREPYNSLYSNSFSQHLFNRITGLQSLLWGRSLAWATYRGSTCGLLDLESCILFYIVNSRLKSGRYLA